MDVSNLPKCVQPYKYWGVRFEKATGEEYIASCPFCRKDDSSTGEGHFFVSGVTGAFDCKFCGKQGSVRSFLEFLYQNSLKETTDEHLLELTRERQIPLPTLRQLGFAKNAVKFFLPVYNENGEVTDLRVIRRGQKEQGTKGCSPGLIGLKDLLDTKRERELVYICEGLTSKASLNWLLWRNKEDGIVISVPGANTFRDEWIIYFDKRNVIICFDHDEAGYGEYDEHSGKSSGGRKVEQKLKGTANSIKFISWPKDFKRGYDVRDHTIRGREEPRKCLDEFRSYIRDWYGTNQQTVSDTVKIAIAEKRIENVKFGNIIERAKEAYAVDSRMENAFKIAVATSISQYLPGSDNVWMFLVGPPGCGKTLILDLFDSSIRTVCESTLTRAGLVSGWSGRDTSILRRVNNKCLVLKDFTEVITQNEKEKKEVYGVLRGAYDGKVHRQFGVINRNYVCNFSILAGVTMAIKGHSTTELGERFLRYNVLPKSRDHSFEENLIDKAMGGQYDSDENKKELGTLLSTFLDNDFNLNKETVSRIIPSWFRNRTIPLGRLIALLRASVPRIQHGIRSNEVIYKPEPEMGSRVAIQLEKLAVCLAVIEEKNEITEGIYELIKQVAMDTIESYSTDIMVNLIKQSRPMSIDEILGTTDVPAMGGLLNDLEVMKIVKKRKAPNSKSVLYEPSKLVRKLWEKSEL